MAVTSDFPPFDGSTDYFSIYTSADGGASWTGHNPTPGYPDLWGSVASSADRKKLVALAVADANRVAPATGDSGIYLSADSGDTWQLSPAQIPTTNWLTWKHSASSADGSKLAALNGHGKIFLSSDSGASWLTANVPKTNWTGIALSADGTKMAACARSICTSTDSGATWTEQPGSPKFLFAGTLQGLFWSSIASSADGNKLVAAGDQGGSTNQMIYTSADSGVTWLSTRLATFGFWHRD